MVRTHPGERLVAAERAVDEIAEQLKSVRRDLQAGRVDVPGDRDSDEDSDCGCHPVLAAALGEIAAVRAELDELAHVNRLLWDRVAGMSGGAGASLGGAGGIRTFRDARRNWKEAGDRAIHAGQTSDRPSRVPYTDPVYGRVLMSVHSSLPVVRAGYSYRSHSILKSMKALGGDVVCYTRLGYPHDLHRLAAVEPASGFRAQDVVDGVAYKRLSSSARRSTISADVYIRNYALALQWAIRQEKAHILHTATNYLNAMAGRMAARDARRPFVHEIRGFWELSAASREPDEAISSQSAEAARLEIEAASHADRVITLNNPMKRELIDRGLDADRIVIVPNGVDPDELSPLPRDAGLAEELGLIDAPTIGYVGSFAYYEGIDDLIQAFRILKSRNIPFNGLLVGDGVMLDTLRNMVEEFGLAGEVKLTGRVPQQDVARYYSLIDIAPFPRKPARVCELVSPIKPFEAMCMGKAVVVSDVEALAEMVDAGRTGLMFDKGSPEHLAAQLEYLIHNDESRSRFGEAARGWVLENRTWRHSASIVNDVYRDLAARWVARIILER